MEKYKHKINFEVDKTFLEEDCYKESYLENMKGRFKQIMQNNSGNNLNDRNIKLSKTQLKDMQYSLIEAFHEFYAEHNVICLKLKAPPTKE